MVAWHDPDSWVTKLFGAHLSTFLITLVVALGFPVLLHLYLYRQRTPASPPAFVLVGPSDAGKTTLVTSLETGRPRETHPTQTPHKTTLALHPDYTPFSARFRSANDPTNDRNRRLALHDTPGHGKLRARSLAAATYSAVPNLAGVVYMVDAAAIANSGGAGSALSDAAEYLHDVLLVLQRRYTGNKTSRPPRPTPVLIAANKMDLFTALPAQLVRAQLEAEIEKVRVARAKGVMDVAYNEEEGDGGDDKELLGFGGEGKFDFKQMEELNVPVEVVGGSVSGQEGPGVDAWWEWIAQQM
ncbi:signal recognition particle receptor beta subunit-domain-containing protein [Phyllosticta citrichinensis]